MPITPGGSEPMITADALASDDIALILPCRRLRSRSTSARLLSASDRLPPDFGLDRHHDAEEAHFRRRHVLVHALQALLERDADLEAFDQPVNSPPTGSGTSRAHDPQRLVGGQARPHAAHDHVDGVGEFVGERFLRRSSGSPAPSAAGRSGGEHGQHQHQLWTDRVSRQTSAGQRRSAPQTIQIVARAGIR